MKSRKTAFSFYLLGLKTFYRLQHSLFFTKIHLTAFAPSIMMKQGLVFNCTIFSLLAAIHLYWATLVVVIGLLLFALCNMAVAGWLGSSLHPTYIRYGILIITIIVLPRAVGDFRYIGITKRHRQSRFARLDTWCYTPLCFALAVSHLILYTLG